MELPQVGRQRWVCSLICMMPIMCTCKEFGPNLPNQFAGVGAMHRLIEIGLHRGTLGLLE